MLKVADAWKLHQASFKIITINVKSNEGAEMKLPKLELKKFS